MRTRLLLLLALFASWVATAPTPASATCIQIEGVGCVNPSCIVAGAGNAALHAAGSEERLHCTR